MIFKKYCYFVLVSCLFLAVTACSRKAAELENPLPVNHDNKFYFINYWAEWCKPCREEIPELNHFLKANAPQVEVFGVNFDGALGADLLRQEAQLGVEFPTLVADPASFLGLSRPTGLPVTVVLDRNGTVTHQLEGEQTQQTLEQILASLLAAEDAEALPE